MFLFQSTRLSRASTDADAEIDGYLIFQSTRLSRASTTTDYVCLRSCCYFNPQGSREPRRTCIVPDEITVYISIHKALASLDGISDKVLPKAVISIHKALASLDSHPLTFAFLRINFNPQGSREPRRYGPGACHCSPNYFNPQGSREPRRLFPPCSAKTFDFNPQGSREPRPGGGYTLRAATPFQSTRLSRASTNAEAPSDEVTLISIHKALASLDNHRIGDLEKEREISIHKALASLDL